jgi:hypothetical protein
MLSFARVRLNMGRSEFMEITPRYFHALCKQLERLDRQRDATLEVMLGQLLAMVGNIGYAGLEKPLQPQDFMPSQALAGRSAKLEDEKWRRKPRMTKARKIALAAQFREAFMYFVEK